MFKKRGFIVFALIICAAIVGIWLISKKSTGNKMAKQQMRQTIKVDAYIVKPSTLIDELSVSGSILAFDEVELRNETSGRITGLNLPEGQKVEKGTLLVKLFDEDIQATIHKLETQLAMQQKILERQKELLAVNGISQNEYDQTELQVNSIKADIEYQKAQLRKTEVRAPFDGVIGLRNVSIGAQVTTGTLLATIRSTGKLKLDFSVPEKYSALIKPGMKIKFTPDGNESKLDANVFATEEGIDAQTRSLKIRALIENGTENLVPGTYSNVTILLKENKNAMTIPTQAIIPSDQNKLVIKAQNGKAHFVKVKTGIRKESVIEITEGLQAGDTILISGILFLKEGAKLNYATITTDSL